MLLLPYKATEERFIAETTFNVLFDRLGET